MVSVMLWLYAAVVMAALLGLVAALVDSSRRRPGRRDYRAMVELHAIRRRADVASFKTGLRRDVADARRQLRAELNDVDGRRQ